MTLSEKVFYHGVQMDKGCSEGMLLAANEVYHLGLDEASCALFAGFRTGMGGGHTCGALLGALGVLSAKFKERPDFKNICAQFVLQFKDIMALQTLECEVLQKAYKKPQVKCAYVMEKTAELLNNTICALELKDLPAPDDIKRLKGLGCLRDKRFNDIFNVRVITRNGKITSKQSDVISQAAKTFGSGEITMTTRLTLEIQGVKYKNIMPLIAYLNEHNLETGGTGSLVRPIVSCKGTTCQFGLIDTFDLSEKMHERFYKGYHSVSLPHKFKIAVGGCPNNCVKPNLNDLGIVGQRRPVLDTDKCRGCKVCQVEKACPIHIAHVENGKVVIQNTECNNCGRCENKCPFNAITYQTGYRIYIGGRWGKKFAHGMPLSTFFTSEEEVLDMVEKAILLFRNEGITGERFSDTIERLGFENTQEKLLNTVLNKDEILNKNVVGGATC